MSDDLIILPDDSMSALEKAITAAGGVGTAELQSYVIIAEWQEPDGTSFISAGQNCPEWKALGLVAYAEGYDLMRDDDEDDD